MRGHEVITQSYFYIWLDEDGNYRSTWNKPDDYAWLKIEFDPVYRPNLYNTNSDKQGVDYFV